MGCAQLQITMCNWQRAYENGWQHTGTWHRGHACAMLTVACCAQHNKLLGAPVGCPCWRQLLCADQEHPVARPCTDGHKNRPSYCFTSDIDWRTARNVQQHQQWGMCMLPCVPMPCSCAIHAACMAALPSACANPKHTDAHTAWLLLMYAWHMQRPPSLGLQPLWPCTGTARTLIVPPSSI